MIHNTIRGGGNADTMTILLEMDHRQRGRQLYQEQSYVAAGREFAWAAADNATDDDDYATLKLHEALCYLRAEQYDAVVDLCTQLLKEENAYSTAICARAYYRRAKAYHLSSNANANAKNTERVLADARRAAFLGDKKAVAFYGQLMRSESETTSASSSPLLALSALFPQNHRNGPSPATGLVQSVVQSLLKRMDDRATQEQICRALQNTSTEQLQQYGALLGLPVAHSAVVRFCHGMSLPRLRRLVRWTKTLAALLQWGRKLLRLGTKYRTLLAVGFLYGWIQAAWCRPLPVSKRRRRAMRAATTVH
jgi:hypothetical protein